MDAPVHQHPSFRPAAGCREHLLEVYRSEVAFIGGLAEFASRALTAGDAFVMIATPEHREQVTAELRARGHDLAGADGAFIALDAAETLARVMVDGQPDAGRFESVVGAVLQRASAGGRPVRAFGEMVALLWEEGRRDATVRLEQLWNRLLARHPLMLFCAYRRGAATRDITDDFARVCAAHSQVAFT